MENNILEYKGYFSKIEYSSKDNVLHGKVEGIADLINFESSNCDEIEKEFQNAVDDYLEFCQEIGKSPEKPYKGSFNVRIHPDLHKKADTIAKKQGITLNQFVSDAIASHLNGAENRTIIYYPVQNLIWGINNPVTNYKNRIKQQTSTSEVKVAWQM
ncbi:MAG: type II toxin-antitoxin system HicB family antitoxin [Oscillospiraceae bacterium]|nr:type II toxin-antitoxin system HicB family antitoxin [Oscillospiraceae bacterium]